MKVELLFFYRATADQRKTRAGVYLASAALRETRTGVYIPDVKPVVFVITVGIIIIQVLHLNILVLCFDILHTITLGLFCIIFGSR